MSGVERSNVVRLVLGSSRIELVEGDITRERIDAIVNAANSRLAGGGGVDGAIHRAGGPTIMEECRAIGGCPTGEARITGAGRLAARWIIHAVGPVYRDGRSGEAALLASAYRSSLSLAVEAGARTVAFPSLSTGAYGYPIDAAARIALGAVHAFLLTEAPAEPGDARRPIELVRFVLFGRDAYDTYAEALRRVEVERTASER